MKKGKRRNINKEYGLRFIQIPKVLFFSEHYKDLSNNAKVAYALLQDRWNLSVHNNWVDKNGDIFFLYTNQKLMEILNIGSSATLQRVKKELINVNLLEQEQRGLNMANRLYLLEPIVEEQDVYKIIQDETDEIENLDEREEEYNKKREEDINPPQTQEPQGNSVSEPPFSESGSSKNEHQDVQKVNTNDTDFTYTNHKDIKDIKESQTEKTDTQIISKSFNSTNKNQRLEDQLIESYISDEALTEIYGEHLINLMQSYSFSEYDTFATFINKLEFAQKSVEKELEIDLPFYEGSKYFDYLTNELSRTFLRVIKQYKAGKVDKIAGFLFISFKNTFEDFGKAIKNDTFEAEQEEKYNKNKTFRNEILPEWAQDDYKAPNEEPIDIEKKEKFEKKAKELREKQDKLENK